MATSPAQIQNFLGGVDYPASKDDLVEHARETGAGDDILGMLQRLGREDYDSPTDVSEALRDMM